MLIDVKKNVYSIIMITCFQFVEKSCNKIDKL